MGFGFGMLPNMLAMARMMEAATCPPMLPMCPTPSGADPWSASPDLFQPRQAESPDHAWAMAQMGMLRSFAEQQQKGHFHIKPQELQTYLTPGKRADNYRPEAAVKLANGLKGMRSEEIHHHSGTFWDPAGFHAPGTNLNNNNCANFVSGLLRKGGGLTRHRTSVPQLEMQLQHDGWSRREDGSTPKPGDVWISNQRGHVEMVHHVDKDGTVWTVGANNQKEGPDGTSGQWISVRRQQPGKGFYLAPPEK